MLAPFFRTVAPAVPPPTSSLVPPYNAVEPLTLPRVYNHDSATHPDVMDFGSDPANWFGAEPRRFWMAYTPYPPNEDENPSILCSHDGENWTTPTGLTNPIYPYQGKGWNADTDLVFDPVERKLGCTWRSNFITHHDGTTDDLERLNLKWSSDGVTWGPRIDVMPPFAQSSKLFMSPAFVREDDGSYTMFMAHNHRYRAPSVTGPWVGPETVRWTGPASFIPWHLNVIRHNGQYRALVQARGYPGESADVLIPAVSEDGLNFKCGTPILRAIYNWEKGPEGNGGLYRSAFLPHENGADYRVWYGGMGGRSGGWRIAYTMVPRKHWDDLA